MRSVMCGTAISLILGTGFGLAQCGTQACPERRAITVNATASATADADQALVRVGYKLYGPDAKSVYASAAESSNSILQALLAQGVAKGSIESSSQVLQHTQPYELQQVPMESEERHRRQFVATQSWTIRVKPDEAAKTLNTAINAGANESGWIEWEVRDPGSLRAQASAKALGEARMLAEGIAEKSQVHLGHLVTASENEGPMHGRVLDGIAGMAMSVGNGGPAQQGLAINSRRVEESVTLFVTYAVE